MIDLDEEKIRQLEIYYHGLIENAEFWRTHELPDLVLYGRIKKEIKWTREKLKNLRKALLISKSRIK